MLIYWAYAVSVHRASFISSLVLHLRPILPLLHCLFSSSSNVTSSSSFHLWSRYGFLFWTPCWVASHLTMFNDEIWKRAVLSGEGLAQHVWLEMKGWCRRHSSHKSGIHIVMPFFLEDWVTFYRIKWWLTPASEQNKATEGLWVGGSIQDLCLLLCLLNNILLKLFLKHKYLFLQMIL